MDDAAGPVTGTISVVLADDNLIVREGVRALIERHKDLRIVGVAADYDEVIEEATSLQPQVLVTDIRMPPEFNREGIDAAKEVRKRHPGTGVVILSQYDDPEYAVSLLAEGSAGYGYLLKDHIAQGDQLVDALRAVATGGNALDPAIVDALVRPVTSDGGLTPGEEELLGMVAEGKPIKAIAASKRLPPEAVDAAVEAVFVKLAEGVSAGTDGALQRLRLLHKAIVDREEQGETLSRLLPGGLAEKLRRDGRHIGETERVVCTVLMSDIRSYSTIAEHADPSQLAGQLNVHRAAMNEAILGENGTVMQFVGDAVMAVFGAPFEQEDHADRAVVAALAMHEKQSHINRQWTDEGVTHAPGEEELLGWSPRASPSRRSLPRSGCRPKRSTPPSRPCSSSWRRECRPAPTVRSSVCGCCTRPSWIARSRGRRLSRLLPGGLAEKLRRDGRHIGETERVVCTVLMSDIRSYSTIAEHADPSQLAGQLNVHRAAMNEAILGENGTVMQFVGDAVMAVFGAPFEQEDHADRAVVAALAMHEKQSHINRQWAEEGLPSFGLGLGLSTGEAAAALLGSEERLEYTLVGDTVNMSQRLQQLAEAGEIVVSQGDGRGLDLCPGNGRATGPIGERTRDPRDRIQTGGRRMPAGGPHNEGGNLTWTPWS